MKKYSPEGFNQPEIDSKDQHIWRNERDIIYSRVRSFCEKNNVDLCCGNGFSINLDGIHLGSHDKIVYCQLFDLIPTWEEFIKCDQLLMQENKKLFVISDNIVVRDTSVFSNITFFDCKELLGTTASYDQNYLDYIHPSKLFSCFIQRVESVRQSWFYFLHHHNLLDKGYVSFLLKQVQSYSELTGKELFEFIHYDKELNQLSHFQNAYESLQDIVPYRNFTENYNLPEYIVDAKYSLDLDTFACQDDAGIFCWTEKVLRTLQLPIIQLMFCQKDSFQTMSNLGFELPGEIMYLDSLPWIQRQQELLNFIIEDSIEWNFKIQKQRAMYNRELLNNWKYAYQKENYFDNAFETILSL